MTKQQRDMREADPLTDWNHKVNSGMTFERIHEIGTERFGIVWFQANRVAVEAFQLYGINPANQILKKALSLAVLRVLEPLVHTAQETK